ncbi:YggS family pyridoxal phosphate-dependent enzyme [Marinimicrobium sp. ABcell2]|uniref:YggS family pyridoxal phosphate-dependent enzyme n=1 Tax=Marinimicrobium sp. ABcell2 TaxID=3069751 RepID=UPI0027B06C53|nr:YggS family pyridoxal phosphate-dependent enzyme [Marinimicrobium sp. ABcell2]MDQ2076584.1 YggS family pyridoxal phosphate-dependent enzyme [Marinimicrobium sp. ABcell2]
MQKIDENLTKVTARLQTAAREAGRNPDEIQLIAVSKTQPAESLAQAWRWGQRRFGENYLQEALDKQAQLAGLEGLEWHFIGPIQSNKTRAIAQHFAWVHSVDRDKIARRLSEQRPPELPPLQVCLQVNIDQEDSKAGVSLAELPTLAQQVATLPGLTLRGLMAIPAPSDSAAQQRAGFARLRHAMEALRAQGLSLDTLSMGMSGDLEAAVAEGATLVRVGTDIFGPRR